MRIIIGVTGVLSAVAAVGFTIIGAWGIGLAYALYAGFSIFAVKSISAR